MATSRPPFNPTRFPGGITNANPGDVLGNFALPDPTKMQTWFEDFIAPPAALGTFTTIAGAGGLVTAATIQAVDTPTASFVLDDSRRFFFSSRLSLATVANTITVGFSEDIADTDDGVIITVANNVLTLSNFVGGSATVTDTATLTTANTVMYEVGFEYVPGKGVSAYVDGNVVARIKPSALTAVNLVAGVYPSGATATIDYIFASVER